MAVPSVIAGTARCLGFAIAIAPTALAVPATAQGQQPLPGLCHPAQDTDAGAAAKVEQLFRGHWLQDGSNWYTAYELKEPPKNPFDLAARQAPPAQPVKGYIWAYGISCQASAAPEGMATRYRLVAQAISFHETGDWTRPLPNALLVDAIVRKTGDGWALDDKSPETSVLAPDMVRRMPDRAELPKPSKALGLPCIGRQRLLAGRCKG